MAQVLQHSELQLWGSNTAAKTGAVAAASTTLTAATTDTASAAKEVATTLKAQEGLRELLLLFLPLRCQKGE